MALKISRSIISIDKDDVLPRLRGAVKYEQKEYKVIGDLDYRDKLILQDSNRIDCEIIVEMDNVKPLLRKMDSMTNDEKNHYQSLLDGVANYTIGVWETTEWLNRNLFDYKDLTGKGLAERI